jgi:sporulation protein YlmC with PRC-barrel domain
MDIPLDTEVYCTDGDCGHSTYVIVNPVSRKVTHLVVQDKDGSHAEHLVPIEWVTEANHDLIRLRISESKLAMLDPFVETDYLWEKLPDFEHMAGGYMILPYRVPETTKMVEVKHRRIPQGELAVHRGARVEAIDGRVGQVDEFLVDPEDSHITHLILREGHLWGQKDVMIPVSAIDNIEENTVYLTLDKHSIEELPTIPLKRDWL